MLNRHRLMTPTEQLAKAYELAATKHFGQFDKAGRPYFEHVSKVRYLLKSDDDELNAIAILHDIMEDTDVTPEYLRSLGFSERVINGIVAMTKRSGESYDDYIQRLLQNRDASLVKMADLRHNSDIRRQKDVRQKDFDRTVKYMKTYKLIKDALDQKDAPKVIDISRLPISVNHLLTSGIDSKYPLRPIALLDGSIMEVIPTEASDIDTMCEKCALDTDNERLGVLCGDMQCVDWSYQCRDVYFKIKVEE